MKNRALFLDRDGTIIEHVHYLNDPKKVKLILPVIYKMKEYQEKGYLLVIVTNQRGISKGAISTIQYAAVHDKMVELLKKYGIKIDAAEMCDAEDDAHPRRKPNPGMLFDASKKFNISLEHSVMVGDKVSDVETGKKAGIKLTFQVREFLSSPVPE